MAAKLNISLEPHLRDALAALKPILPEETSQQLNPHLSSGTSTSDVPVIPYELVLEISKWCQTTDGKAALQACSPPLDPLSYSMVSLLAGVRTSPEKHFPPYVAKDPREEHRQRARDRKAIATLVNAVLSVLGTGLAAWSASEHVATRLEWRALLAVSAALVVASVEIVLYMIWDARQSSRPRQPARTHVLVRKKDDAASSTDPDVATEVLSTALGDTNLRHRTTAEKAE